MENSSEFFYEKLKTSTNPGPILAAFYCTLYDKEVSKSEIIMCNRLLKVFERFTIFFSILDMAGSYETVEGNPFPLLYTICKRRFEVAHNGAFIQARESLSGYIDSLNKETEKILKQKIKIPSSKGLEPDGR